jgi:DNA invertase Pin-like site-specific DNA recombinase
MKIGYARTSTVEQVAGFEAQVRDLEAAGCEGRDIYREQVSSVAQRPELELVLDRILRSGDALVVTKLDRLARSTQHLLGIAERIKQRGATLQILNLGLDTSTATGKLLFTIIGAIAEFEREMMLERQREGIAKAKGERKYKGRVPTARRQAPEIRQLFAEGLRKAEIARRLGIGTRSVFRVLEENRE